MNSEDVARFLISAEAETAAATLGDVADTRRALLQLRKTFNAWQASALVDQARARRSLAARHSAAKILHLDTLAAAQASSEVCARRRVSRFPMGATVADLGCSVGLDSLELAARGPLIALDRDRGRLILARANLERCGREALFVQGLAERAAPHCDFLHADPDRRPDGERRQDPEEASPRLSQLLALEPKGGLAVKLSPMADLQALEGLGELEFVGLGSELKEIVLYTGALAQVSRRVALADLGVDVQGPMIETPASEQLGEFIIEAHAALIRSGLLGALAAEEGLRLVSPQVAFLTAAAPSRSPFFRSFRVLEQLPAQPNRVRKSMKEHGIERLEVASRAFPGDAMEFERAFARGKGPAGRLFLTRIDGRPAAVLARRLDSPSS